jgi:hypothetical protein
MLFRYVENVLLFLLPFPFPRAVTSTVLYMIMRGEECICQPRDVYLLGLLVNSRPSHCGADNVCSIMHFLLERSPLLLERSPLLLERSPRLLERSPRLLERSPGHSALPPPYKA